MTRHTLTAALLCAGVAWAQEPFDKAAADAYQQEVVANRAKGLYRRIDWRESPAEARKAAEESQKPLLVFVVVGEMARKGAADC